MEYRKFGNTDFLVSEIGFGAWAIGGNAMVGDRTTLHAINNTTGITTLTKDDVDVTEHAFFTHFSELVDLMGQKG